MKVMISLEIVTRTKDLESRQKNPINIDHAEYSEGFDENILKD